MELSFGQIWSYHSEIGKKAFKNIELSFGNCGKNAQIWSYHSEIKCKYRVIIRKLEENMELSFGN